MVGSAVVVGSANVVVVGTVSTVAGGAVVPASPPSGLHAAATTKRVTATRWDLYVAVSDDVAENQAPNASPNDREVLSDSVDGRPIRNPKDGCQGYTPDNAHENRSQEVVGSTDETADKPAHGSNASDDCERLPDLSVKEHQRETSGAGLPSYESPACTTRR